MWDELTKGQFQNEYPADISPESDPDLLPDMDRHQVVFYDEIHMEQEERGNTRSVSIDTRPQGTARHPQQTHTHITHH